MFINSCHSGKVELSPADMAKKNTEEILSDWNTWDYRSVLSYVYLPDELTLSMQIKDGKTEDILSISFTGNQSPGAEIVKTIAHTPDGSFTDMTLSWHKIPIRVQAVSEKTELFIRISRLNEPTCKDLLIVKNDFFYNHRGDINIKENSIFACVNENEFITTILDNKSVAFGNDGIAAPLKGEIYISCGKEISTSEIDKKILEASIAWNERNAKYGNYAESFNAIQNAINWTPIYDPVGKQAVIPVARPWTYGWSEGRPGGYIRFCWDNFFVAYMQTCSSKELAFSEAIQMCDYIDKYGFVPNFIAQNDLASRDRSQPPVGSMMVKEIYKAFPEKWFLEKTFDQLLKWNRWWNNYRDQNGYLAWGSNPYNPPTGDKREKVQNVFRAACYESGLDNSPMYDGVKFDTTIHMLLLGDVGLMGLYVGDCEALADIASVLGRSEEKELRERAEYYRNNIKTMWDDDFGLFLNKRMDTGELSKRISPTCFYALIAKAATQEQAERMMNEHFYNPDEFWGEYIMPSIARNDTAYTGEDYWRGSIWAPMNFLVYYGMRNYDLPQARKDLSEKSKNLLMKEWLNQAYIRENYNADTGEAPSKSSNPFYHWGALLGMINMIEEAYVPPTEIEIK